MIALQHLFERLIYACRWLLAPIYLGMGVALLALTVKFFQELWHLFAHILDMHGNDLVLMLISLVDMSLVGGLLVMVMLAGYENAVSQLDVGEDTEKLDWLGKLDPGSLKMKLAASIVAISSIHLLEIFMNAEKIANDKILWSALLHLTFVASALMMAVLDRLSKQSHAPR